MIARFINRRHPDEHPKYHRRRLVFVIFTVCFFLYLSFQFGYLFGQQKGYDKAIEELHEMAGRTRGNA